MSQGDSKVTLTFSIYKGDQLVRTEQLSQNVIKVGKLPSSHLRIDDDNVSRMHAVIEVTSPSEIFIIDLGSASGTVVNGKKVNKTQLNDGDEIQLGGSRIVVKLGAAGEVAASAPAAPPVAAPAPAVPPARAAAAVPSNPPVPPSAPPAGSMPAAPPPPNPFAAPPAGAAPVANPFAAPAAVNNPFAPVAHRSPSPASEPPDPSKVEYGIAASGPAVRPDEVETSETVAEVVVMWGDKNILHVEHLNPMRNFYVGEEADEKGNLKVDFLLGADTIGAPKMPVLVASGGSAAAVIPNGATGEITVGDQRMTVEEIVSSGRTQPCPELPGAQQYPLPAGATARIKYNGFTFVTRPVPAGKVIGDKQDYDPKPFYYIGAAGAVFAIVMTIMYFMPPASSSLSLDLLSQDSRLVDYLTTPEELVEEETPEWLQDSKQSDSEGGKGKRHKDEEGAMGKKEAKKSNNRYGIEGPADNEDPHMARERAKDQARTAGILGVLAASTGAFNSPTSPFGRDTALGNDSMSALGALMGDQVGENFGFGGLGLRGTGRGGGGTGEGTIGLGNIGTIGHGAGGGSGSGYGRGAGGFRGREGRVPKIRSGSADVRGSLSKEVIRRVVRRHQNEVRFCYEQELNQRPDLEGRVTIGFIISPTGAVQSSSVADSTLGNSRVETCIASAVRRWSFPAPDGGGIVVVNYPFLLQSN